MPPIRRLVTLTLVVLGVCAAEAPAAATGGELNRFELLGEAVIPSSPEGAPIGGLSALLYRPETGDYLAISDDGAVRGPARFYTLEIALAPTLDPDGVQVVATTEILDADGRSFRPRTVDPEGIAPSPDGGLFVSSEGRVKRGADPFVRRYARDGRMLAELPVPGHYLPGERPADVAIDRWGVRHNLGFESLTVTPPSDHAGEPRFLFSATENALAQDGPEATVAGGSPARLLRWELAADGSAPGPPREWVYPVDPVARPPHDPEALTVAGLVELLALRPETLLALERSFTEGVGTTVRLYRVSLAEATEVTGRANLREDLVHGRIRSATKTLLLDLAEVLEEVGIPLDNVEGMTFGPDLADSPDGRRTLLLVSDDNFAEHQRTQVLAFAVDDAPVSIAGVQGRAHRSPLEGEWIRGLRGVVTAVDPTAEVGRFWIQAPEGRTDDDPATAEGLEVRLREGARSPLPGTLVELSGRVAERGFPGALTVTTLTGARVHPLGHAPVPEAVPLGSRPGRGGRTLVPQTFDDDALATFQATGEDADGIDLWESLEGVRVTVPEPVVIGPTTEHGGFGVLPDGGAGASLRTCAGGLLARPDDFNPERVLVDTGLLESVPSLRVGDLLGGPLVGVAGYGFGAYRVLATEPVPAPVRTGANPYSGAPPPPGLPGTPPPGSLTVATYNVLNLHPGSGDERFRRLAKHLVADLGAPDLVALQEIQDASGPADDGVVAGGPTFERLIDAIEAADGPEYTYRQIDPVDGTEGGQPGGNIRVGFLIRPGRLEIAGPPRHVAPDHPCFTGAGRDDFEPTRRSLALELRFGPRTLFVVDNHWRSKRGDDRLFGATQPPVRHTEAQRTCQARVVAGFVRRILAADPDAWVIVAGDLNEHEFRPPLAELEAAGMVNLMHRVPQADRYTYNFEGNSQVLDHVLVSPGLLRDAVAIPSIAHVNTDLPASEAASDHDPVLVTIVGPERPPRPGETDAPRNP